MLDQKPISRNDKQDEEIHPGFGGTLDLVMNYVEKNRYYPVLQASLERITQFMIYEPHSVDLSQLLSYFHIDIQRMTSRCHSPANEENEIKALVLAKCVLVWQEFHAIHDTNPHKPVLLQSDEDIKRLFADQAVVNKLFFQNHFLHEKNPFIPLFSPRRMEGVAEEWTKLREYANYMLYVVYLLKTPPNKVVCMRCCAILTGFDKCQEGGWKGLGMDIKRRHLLFHQFTQIRRQVRVTRKKLEEGRAGVGPEGESVLVLADGEEDAAEDWGREHSGGRKRRRTVVGMKVGMGYVSLSSLPPSPPSRRPRTVAHLDEPDLMAIATQLVSWRQDGVEVTAAAADINASGAAVSSLHLLQHAALAVGSSAGGDVGYE
eukprot:gene26772-32350_t